MAEGLEALPCLICDAAMTSKRDRLGIAYTHQHPPTDCLLSGLVVGGHETHQWNTRGRLAYSVVNEVPMFNTKGEGTLCTPNMVNMSIDYCLSKKV